MSQRLANSLLIFAFVFVNLVMTQRACANGTGSVSYVSLGIIYDSPLNSSSDSHGDNSKMARESDSQFGLDINYGLFVFGAAGGLNLKYFENNISVGAFAGLWGIFLEAGVAHNPEMSTADPYLGAGFSMGYAEVSARQIYGRRTASELLLGIKVPLEYSHGSVKIIHP